MNASLVRLGNLDRLRSRVGKRWALFFDIDGTLFKSQWAIRLLLACAELIPDKRLEVEPLRLEIERYERQMTYDYRAVIACSIEIIDQQKFFRGLHREQVRMAAMRVLKELGGMRYRFTTGVITSVTRQAPSERGPLIALTGSPMDVAEPFCSALGFDAVFGTILHVEGDFYTGELDLHAVDHKGDMVRTLAEELELDLAQSAAFGDSVTDLDMLLSVGFPFAVNPDRELLAQVRLMPEKICLIQDRQKSGTLFFQPLDDGRLLEVDPRLVLPPYLQHVPEYLAL